MAGRLRKFHFILFKKRIFLKIIYIGLWILVFTVFYIHFDWIHLILSRKTHTIIDVPNNDRIFFDGFMVVEIKKNHIELIFKKDNGYKIESVGKSMQLQGTPKVETSRNYLQAIWENGIELIIKGEHKNFQNHMVFSMNIKWSDPKRVSDSLEECWDMGSYNWYGGGGLRTQPWPVQNKSFPSTAFFPGATIKSVVAPFFLSSESVYLFAKPENPLFVSIETNKLLCFRSKFADPYRNTNGRTLSLDYNRTIVDPSNMTAAWLYFISTIGKPKVAPSFTVIQNPVWSTWAAYKRDINQTSVIDFANQIHRRGFAVSQIEIDDNWETCYGQEEFDPLKFPDPAAMVNKIKSLGYDITLWVHPFVNPDCPIFANGSAKKYFVSDKNGDTILVSWWHSNSSGYIDVTNPAAQTWWDSRLQALKSLGFDSFKFDAGEPLDGAYSVDTGYLNAAEDLQPAIYTTKYHNFIKKYGGRVETRVAYLSQDQGGIFVRLGDRASSWSLKNGLRSVITSTLHYGIVGYPFVLPDYIGGNAYGNWPDRELFIRWTELNAFLPVLQFSILPWTYDDEVNTVAQNMITLHQSIIDVFQDCVNQALQDGSPIIRPLWWINPNDETSQTVNDQFLVGSTYLVAPIVTKGAVSRNIYIPPGTWIDMLRGGQVAGPVWLNDYGVALDEIAYFRNAYALVVSTK